MAIDKNKLRIALSQIHEDEMGLFLTNSFLDLGCQLPNIIEKTNKPLFFKNIQYLHDDIWNIESIFLKSSWMRNLWSQGQIEDMEWYFFATSDINYFHIEFRSIFDYLARVIGETSNLPEKVSRSFEILKNWILKSRNIIKIDSNLRRIILSCEWFNDMREIRDSIVHKGAETMPFFTKYRITFQVHQGLKNKISIPEIMYNPNVVDFELYAGLYIGYLLSYLEEISELFYRLLDLEKTESKSKSYHPGLKTVRDWIERVSLL
jgi:hypothetical protein